MIYINLVLGPLVFNQRVKTQDHPMDGLDQPD